MLRNRYFLLALVGCACATLPVGASRAQTTVSAPVSATGLAVIETGGAYSGSYAAGTDRYLDGGANNTYPSFDVLDFTVGSFGLTAPVTSVSSLTFTVTEADYASSKAGGFEVYLSEDTNSIATANGGSPLVYQKANAPGGVGTQLGDATSLFAIGSFTSDASATSVQTDTYTLTLSSAAQAYFTQQLNSGASSDLRLVIASTDSNGYLTLDGNTGEPAGTAPTLGFTAVLNQPSLSWQPGGSTNGGSGTWLPAGTAGDTNWSGGPWNSADVAIFTGTGSAVAIGAGGVTAVGIQFGTGGYTLGSTSGPAITLTNAGTVQVTNATDTDTINAPLAGTVGLNKTGAGTLILGGQSTYSGGTTISGGVLQVSADANLGAAGTDVALNGGTLQAVGTNVALTRGFTGNGGVSVAAGSTLTVSGTFNVGTLTLPGGGTLSLTGGNGSVGRDGSDFGFTGLTFQTAGASVLTQDPATGGANLGIVDLGTGGIIATHASGTVSASAIFQVAAGTIPINVANAGAMLNLAGIISGGGVLAKTGAGTLVLAGDNSLLSGLPSATAGASPVSFRQGSAAATPATGGVVSITATTNPGSALGTGEFQANGGTISNDTGAAITLAISDISLGARDSTATPGGLIFAGSGGITVTGPISLYKGTTTAYQHAITVNTPTTFTGVLTASANTTTSTGLTISGSSTLTLAGTSPNTLFEPITIATSGANAGVIAASEGAFAASTAITLNAGAKLTLSTGAQSGTVNTINDNALLSFLSNAGTFGKLVLNIGTGQETVGGLYLATSEGQFSAGYLPAGTYGSSTSGAMYQDNTLFSGSGILVNTNAVPEPSAWAAVVFGGLLGLAAVGRGRRRA